MDMGQTDRQTDGRTDGPVAASLNAPYRGGGTVIMVAFP